MKMNRFFTGAAFLLAIVLVVGALPACDEEKPADPNQTPPADTNPGGQPPASSGAAALSVDPGLDGGGCCPVTGKTAVVAAPADGCGGCETDAAKSSDGCGGCETDATADAMAPAAADGCGGDCGDECSEEKKKECGDSCSDGCSEEKKEEEGCCGSCGGEEKESSRVGPGSCPPRPPTDPDVRVFRIRLFRYTVSLRDGRRSGRRAVSGAGNAGGWLETAPTKSAPVATVATAISSRSGGGLGRNAPMPDRSR